MKNSKEELIQELKANGIVDSKVLDSIKLVPRSFFVENSIKSRSNSNIALPIECGQTISQPLVVAFMTQNLFLNKRLRVLEIGTGSGYQTVILSKLSRFVYTIERYLFLKKKAEEKFRKLNITNIFCKHGDGGLGWYDQAPFDRIMITAAAPEIPMILLDQLKDEGVMIIPIGEENDTQYLTLIQKKGKSFSKKNLMKVRFVPLLEGKVNK